VLPQALSGRIGCPECCGSGVLALAATQPNSSRARCIRSTGSSQCSRSGRFAACSAGGVITGFHSEPRNEHPEIGLDSHVKRSSAMPHVKALRASSELSDRCSECRRCAECRECASGQHWTIFARVRADRTVWDSKRLQPTGGESPASKAPIHECSRNAGLDKHGESAKGGWFPSSSATRGSPCVWRPLQRIGGRDRRRCPGQLRPAKFAYLDSR
jgi:hypothetical protein